MCCNEFVGYQGTTNGSSICEGSGGLAFNGDSEFECKEWPVLRRAYCSLEGSERAAAIQLLSVVCIRFRFAFTAVWAFCSEGNIVGLNFFLCAFICHVSALPIVETGSFCRTAIHFGLTGWLDLVSVILLTRTVLCLYAWALML